MKPYLEINSSPSINNKKVKTRGKSRPKIPQRALQQKVLKRPQGTTYRKQHNKKQKVGQNHNHNYIPGSWERGCTLNSIWRTKRAVRIPERHNFVPLFVLLFSGFTLSADILRKIYAASWGHKVLPSYRFLRPPCWIQHACHVIMIMIYSKPVDIIWLS